MKILAVDTALGACSAAILEDDAILSHRFEPMERGHAERLAPMVREAVEESGLAFAGLDRLAVTVGPGTFTGQRVGYAFMRGLRLALGQPLIGVTTLAAMARAAIAQTGASGAAVLHDARRDEVYVMAVIDGSAAVPVRIANFDDAVGAILAAASAAEPLAFAGTAGLRAAEIFRAQGRPVLTTDILTPDALWVARLALAEPVPATVPPPLYLRSPDARLPTQAMSAIAIRPGTLADLPVIADLHAQCFADAWDEAFLARLLAQRGAFHLLAIAPGAPAAFVIARAAADEAEILSLGVHPGFRRRGLGGALARAAAAQAVQAGAVEIFLEVAIDNDAARALYRKLGFREVGRRPGYYRTPAGLVQDAFVLKRGLPL